jgi:hypothetical protein
MSALFVSLLLAMTVEGAGGCPAPAEVDAGLAPLLPPGFASASTDRALIVEEPDGLSLSLARSDGRTIAHRRLPQTGTCAEQAETVAVTLAVWEAQIHPEIALRLDRLAGTPARAAAVPAVADRPPTLVQSAAPAPAREFAASIGAAAVGGWQPDSVAPGGRLDATLGPERRPWRARLSLAALGDHTARLPPGNASWWRSYAALGADAVLSLAGRWRLALGAAGVLGVKTAAGSGFSTDQTARSIDLGLETTLRAELRLGAVRPWLGLALLTWLGRQTLEVTGASSAVLPRLEPLLALGADFCWRP